MKIHSSSCLMFLPPKYFTYVELPLYVTNFAQVYEIEFLSHKLFQHRICCSICCLNNCPIKQWLIPVFDLKISVISTTSVCMDHAIIVNLDSKGEEIDLFFFSKRSIAKSNCKWALSPGIVICWEALYTFITDY